MDGRQHSERERKFTFAKKWMALTSHRGNMLLWPPYVIGQAIILLPCGLYLLSSSFFSSPNLSGRRLDVYHTSTLPI